MDLTPLLNPSERRPNRQAILLVSDAARRSRFAMATSLRTAALSLSKQSDNSGERTIR